MIDRNSTSSRRKSGSEEVGKLTSGPIGGALLSMAGPLAIGMFSVILFQLVDTIFIAQLGSDPLAAISFSFPVIFIVNSIILGIGTGLTATMAKSIGRGDWEEAKTLATNGLLLGLSIIILLASLGKSFTDKIFDFLGASVHQMVFIHDYLDIWFSAVVLVVVPMLGNSMLRATGDTKAPTLVMLSAGLLNIILDPILIFGCFGLPEMGVKGASLATAIAYGLALSISFYMVAIRKHIIHLKKLNRQDFIFSTRRILKIGLPTAASNLLIPFSLFVLTHFVAALGPEAVGAFGVCGRIEAVALTGVFAMASVMTAFIGQNLGSGNYERIRAGLRFARFFALAWGVFLTLLFGVFFKEVASIFAADLVTQNYIELFLLSIPFSYGMLGIAIISASACNGIHRPQAAIVIIAVRLFVFSIPLSLLGIEFFGLPGMFGAQALSNVLIGVVTWVWVSRLIRNVFDHST